jgi:hypothetical protein
MNDALGERLRVGEIAKDGEVPFHVEERLRALEDQLGKHIHLL